MPFVLGDRPSRHWTPMTPIRPVLSGPLFRSRLPGGEMLWPVVVARRPWIGIVVEGRNVVRPFADIDAGAILVW